MRILFFKRVSEKRKADFDSQLSLEELDQDQLLSRLFNLVKLEKDDDTNFRSDSDEGRYNILQRIIDNNDLQESVTIDRKAKILVKELIKVTGLICRKLMRYKQIPRTVVNGKYTETGESKQKPPSQIVKDRLRVIIKFLESKQVGPQAKRGRLDDENMDPSVSASMELDSRQGLSLPTGDLYKQLLQLIGFSQTRFANNQNLIVAYTLRNFAYSTKTKIDFGNIRYDPGADASKVRTTASTMFMRQACLVILNEKGFKTLQEMLCPLIKYFSKNRHDLTLFCPLGTDDEPKEILDLTKHGIETERNRKVAKDSGRRGTGVKQWGAGQMKNPRGLAVNTNLASQHKGDARASAKAVDSFFELENKVSSVEDRGGVSDSSEGLEGVFNGRDDILDQATEILGTPSPMEVDLGTGSSLKGSGEGISKEERRELHELTTGILYNGSKEEIVEHLSKEIANVKAHRVNFVADDTTLHSHRARAVQGIKFTGALSSCSNPLKVPDYSDQKENEELVNFMLKQLCVWLDLDKETKELDILTKTVAFLRENNLISQPVEQDKCDHLSFSEDEEGDDDDCIDGDVIPGAAFLRLLNESVSATGLHSVKTNSIAVQLNWLLGIVINCRLYEEQQLNKEEFIALKGKVTESIDARFKDDEEVLALLAKFESVKALGPSILDRDGGSGLMPRRGLMDRRFDRS